MSYLDTFEPKLEKTIVIFEISTFEFVKMQSFTLNQKNPKETNTKTKQKKQQKNRKRKKIKFGTKIVLLGVGFGLEFEKSLSYLKPSILNLSNFQVIGPKLPSLSIFKLEFEKSSVIFEINTLEFIKIKFLTFLVNFDIASTFSKGPGSQFF